MHPGISLLLKGTLVSMLAVAGMTGAITLIVVGVIERRGEPVLQAILLLALCEPLSSWGRKTVHDAFSLFDEKMMNRFAIPSLVVIGLAIVGLAFNPQLPFALFDPAAATSAEPSWLIGAVGAAIIAYALLYLRFGPSAKTT